MRRRGWPAVILPSISLRGTSYVPRAAGATVSQAPDKPDNPDNPAASIVHGNRRQGLIPEDKPCAVYPVRSEQCAGMSVARSVIRPGRIHLHLRRGPIVQPLRNLLVARDQALSLTFFHNPVFVHRRQLVQLGVDLLCLRLLFAREGGCM